MNVTDVVLLLALGAAGFRGYQRGFIVSLLSIVAFWVAIVMAFMFLDWGVQFLDDMVEGFTGLLPYMAFVLIFVVVAIAINVAGKLLKTTIDLTLLGKFDSFAGSILAILTWAFGISLLMWLTGKFGYEVPLDWSEGSLLYSKIQSMAPAVIDVFSEYLPFLEYLFESIAERLSPDNP